MRGGMVVRRWTPFAAALLAFASSFTMPAANATPVAGLGVGGAVAAPPPTVEGASWIVELDAAPLATAAPSSGGLRSVATADAVARIAAEQSAAIALIRATAPTANVVRSYRVVHNGFELRASASDVVALRAAGLDVAPNVPVSGFLAASTKIVRADQVWTAGPAGPPVTGRGVTVAVLDTGVDYTHADLGGCFGPGCKVAGGYDFVNGDGNPLDDNGHGTHVAAIAAGNGTYKGVAPDATVLAYKVMDASANGTAAWVIAGLERAIDPDGDGDTRDAADVVNVSLGCTDPGLCTPDDDLSRAVDRAVSAGTVVVAAVGNTPAAGIASPASARTAIAVGASDGEAGTASFTAEGPVSWDDNLLGKPDLVAPGVGICAARASAAPVSNTCGPSKFVRRSGTSMAAPHVAGAAALLLQARPDLRPDQVSALLKGSARPITETNNTGTGLGAGLLDVRAAVTMSHGPSAVAVLEPISATAWPRVVRARIDAPGLTSWRLEAAGVHNPTWQPVTQGTDIPADGVLHTFPSPIYDSPGPRLRLVVETAAGGRAVDQTWLPPHAEQTTAVLAPTKTGMQHNGWSGGSGGYASDDQYVEAADDVTRSTIGVDYSIDNGASWKLVGDIALHTGADGRVTAAVPTPGLTGAQVRTPGLLVRLRTAAGLASQDFGGFAIDVPADATISSILVILEGHTRQTTDPILGQPVAATRRIDEVDVRLRYRLGTAAAVSGVTASFAAIAAAPVCGLACHTEPQVAVRSDGRPVVAYRDIAADALALFICGDASCQSGNVHTLVEGAPGCPAGCLPARDGFPSVSLTLRPDDRPVITYVANGGGAAPYSRDLWIVSCGDGLCRTGNTYTKIDVSGFEPTPPGTCVLFVCQPGTPLPPRTVVGTTSLALNASGQPVIAYAARVPDAEDTAVRVLVCSDPLCRGSISGTTIEGPGCTGLCDAKSEVVFPMSVQLRPDGRPTVAYQQQYVWNGSEKTSVARIKLATCGDTRCTASNSYALVTPHTGYAPALRLRPNGLPTVAFLAGGVPQPQVVACRTATCAGPYGSDQSYAATALDGPGPCQPGCNPRTTPGFEQGMVLGVGNAPIVALQDQRASSLKLISCADAQCSHGTRYMQVDGAPSCPAGCDPDAQTGAKPSMARRASDGAIVLAYRDLTNMVLKVAVVQGI